MTSVEDVSDHWSHMEAGRQNKGASHVSSWKGSLNFRGSWLALRKDTQGTWDTQPDSWRRLTACPASKLDRYQCSLASPPAASAQGTPTIPLSPWGTVTVATHFCFHLCLSTKNLETLFLLTPKTKRKARVMYETPSAKEMSHVLHHQTEVITKML